MRRRATVPGRRPASSLEAGAALAAFLSWPAAASAVAEAEAGGGERRKDRRPRMLATAALTVAVSALLGALSFAAPLVGVSGHPWMLGAHLLLFCHLS